VVTRLKRPVLLPNPATQVTNQHKSRTMTVPMPSSDGTILLPAAICQ
jgi:hypothetical protein